MFKPQGLVAAAVVIAVLAGCASRGDILSSPPSGMNLSGNWRFDPAASDDVAPDSARAGGTPAGGPPSGGPRGGGMGGPGGMGSPGGMGGAGGMGGGPGGPGGPGVGGRPGARGRGGMAFMPFREFTLEQTDSTITFRFRGGEPAVVPVTDEEVRVRNWPGGVEASTRAAWTSGGLVLEREVEDGGSIKEVYRVSQDGSRLIVTAEISGMGGREMRRVYTRTDRPADADDPADPVY